MSSSLLSTPKQKGDLYLASSLCDGLEDNNLRQVITLLKSKEADPNVLMPLHGITPFHLVIGNDSETFAEEVTKLFLRHAGNPNVKSVDGMTPVHVAAAWGRVKILDLLLANGGDPLCIDADYRSPFHYAFEGKHYEAVSILSKYCINEEQDDENPKFKRELDKVLINNGDVLAEYIVSDDSLTSSYYSNYNNSFNTSNNSNGCSKINTSSCVSEKNVHNAMSINSDFVTLRQKQKKSVDKISDDETNNNIFYNNEEYNFDFKRKTIEEEKSLINEIISQLSNSITSDTNPNNITLNNINIESLCSHKTSSPKKKQITMTFNRAKKNNEHSVSERPSTNKRYSTLQVIKQHNQLPNFKNNRFFSKNIQKSSNIKITEPNKTFALKKNIQPLTKNVTPKKSKMQIHSQQNSVHNWLDETIISKSPNFEFTKSLNERSNLLLKTPTNEKQATPRQTQITTSLPTSFTSKNSNKNISSIKTISRIPRPKTYLTTASNIKLSQRTKEIPSKINIPSKRKADSLKKTIGKPKNLTPLNQTYSKLENSNPSLSLKLQELHNSGSRKRNLKNIAVNLNSHMFDNDEDQENSLNLFLKNKSKIPSNQNIISSNVKNRNHLESEMISKPDSKTNSIETNEEMLNCDLKDIDFNQAIIHSLSYREHADETFHKGNENFKSNSKSIEACDSLICSHGSTNSDSNDSFLSLSKLEDYPNADNNADSNKEKFNSKTLLPVESNSISIKSNSCSGKKFDTETFRSVQEEYKYEDPEEGIVFLERRLCVSPPCSSSEINTSFYSCMTTKSEPIPKEMFLLDHVAIRERLKNFGENPGPITNTTHRLYLKRLHKLETQNTNPMCKKEALNSKLTEDVNFDIEKKLLKSSLLSINWIKNIDDFEAIEETVFLEFASPNPTRKWREGTSKSSFNYLLLDPRITKDLPRRAKNLSLLEQWEIFLAAIFYVGKGKRSRPYAHLYDAFKIWVSNDQNPTNKKISRILDIWNEGKGVVVLHVFQNTIPAEAYTREAMMIEVLGTQKLGNCKCGDYYGVISTWRSKEKCELGMYLLYKALLILLLEGERQIFPDNL